MALLIFNIGWMKHYKGQTQSDRIVNGGSYVSENQDGEEVKNFLPIGDSLYGYVRIPGGGKLDLERLGAAPGATHVDDVTIVFSATPLGGGCVVVGWYHNARVWRDQQKFGERIYFAKARKENCKLLEVPDRTLSVPRARKGIWGRGQSNIRYVEEAAESEDFVCRLRELIGLARSVPQELVPLPKEADEESFDPNNEEDARKWMKRTIVQRRGQKQFRDSLLSAYEEKCAITGCSILDVLEAAHIAPYRGPHTDRTSNGLLLRADLHTLFDCQLLAIDPDTMEVLLAPRMAESEYKKWCGRRIWLPENTESRPNTEALRKHLGDCKNAWGE